MDGRVLESSNSDIVLLKLESGYNVGIPKENILGSRVLKKYKEVDDDRNIKQNSNLPKIGLLVTGGTIASRASYSTGGVKPITNV